MGGAIAGWQGVADPLCPPLCSPAAPSVVGMTMLCALLLLSTLVRQTEYSLKMFRLRHLLTLLCSICLVKSLLDISVKECVDNKYYGLFTFFRHRYFSFLALNVHKHTFSFAPQPSVLSRHCSPLHQKSWRLPCM